VFLVHRDSYRGQVVPQKRGEAKVFPSFVFAMNIKVELFLCLFTPGTAPKTGKKANSEASKKLK
jgi:hypothetical protein